MWGALGRSPGEATDPASSFSWLPFHFAAPGGRRDPGLHSRHRPHLRPVQRHRSLAGPGRPHRPQKLARSFWAVWAPLLPSAE